MKNPTQPFEFVARSNELSASLTSGPLAVRDTPTPKATVLPLQDAQSPPPIRCRTAVPMWAPGQWTATAKLPSVIPSAVLQVGSSPGLTFDTRSPWVPVHVNETVGGVGGFAVAVAAKRSVATAASTTAVRTGRDMGGTSGWVPNGNRRCAP